MGKDAPDPPDYESLARLQFQQNQQLVKDQTRANRPNVTTPWGRDTWVEGADGRWSRNVSLDPADQKALDAQQQVNAARATTAQGMFGRVRHELGKPVDFSKFGDYGELGDYDARRQSAEDAAYGRATSRLDPYWQQQTEQMDITLRNQGLNPGDEAYDKAMANTMRARNDAYENAQNTAVMQGRDESKLAFGQQLGTAEYTNRLRTQKITEELQKRGWSLNEINALMTGGQIQMPGAPANGPQSTASRTTAPDYVSAAAQGFQDQMTAYNTQQQQQQGMFSGIASLFMGGAPIPGF